MSYYDDIINLPHHVSQRHPRMSMYNRAAQFSPFAALTGYEKAIEEARRKLEEYQGGTKSLGKEAWHEEKSLGKMEWMNRVFIVFVGMEYGFFMICARSLCALCGLARESLTWQ